MRVFKYMCDVKQPSCANCDKKGLDCSFLLLAPTSRLSVVPSISSEITPLRDGSPSTISESGYITSPSNISSAQSASPCSAVSNNELIPSPQRNVVTENELTYGLEDFSFAPLTPLTIQSNAIPEDSMAYLSQDSSILSLPLPLEPLPLDIPPALPIPTSWSPILPSLPASLRTILSHYEYTSSLTLHPSDPAKAAWLTHLPSLAINHSYLLNCVLSVASLHLGRLNVYKRVEMNALAASRMNKALSTYRAELAHVTRDNAAALFASATLTAVYLFRTTSLDMEELRSSIPPGTLTPPADVTEKMLACALRPIWGLRGPLTVLMSGWTWVTSGKMQSVAARKWWPQNIVPATSQAFEEDERLARLGEAWDAEDLEKMDLIQALGFLREAFALVSQLTLPDVYPPMTAIPYSVDDTNVGVLTDRGAIFVWGTRISREFMQRVEARDRDALVVLAHYAILPGRVRNVWWLEGLGADMVTAIAMTLGKENWGLIEWPASVVGVELDNLFDPRRDRLQGQPEEMGMEVI